VPWEGAWQRVTGNHIRFRAERRPFIGVSPHSAPYLTSFLKQQGYLVEPATHDRNHTFFLDRAEFSYLDERPLLAQIENGNFPLIRFGRWPNGSRSALSITGDIDALTIWDYILRSLGK
jgi:hypothetical protein